ncbi:TPA: hypothetical protein ACGO8I_002351 [Streptococcus suis]|nr:hypothetical protein [Streptococcus suis]
MSDEVYIKKLDCTAKIFFFLCFMWIPYIGFLLYWMTQDETLLAQLILMIFIIPAVHQPLFWYFVLGFFLCFFTGLYSDKLDVLLGNKPTFFEREKKVVVQQRARSPIPSYLFYWTLFK